MSEAADPFRASARLWSRLDHGPAIRTYLAGLALLPLLAGCARQAGDAISQAPETPGFLLGLWHGFIFPVAWLLSLILPDVAVYAVPNTGGWYDFGFFIGIVFLGVGARKTKTVTVYVDRWRGR